MNLSGLNTTSLKEYPHRERVLRILNAALSAVEPGQAITHHLQREDNWLIAEAARYNLNDFQRIRLVGLGKAAVPMAIATTEILGTYISDGVVVTKFGHLDAPNLPDRIQFIESSHPVPDQHSVTAATRVREFLLDGQPDDLVIVLISGGGSALLVDPVPGLTLSDLQVLTRLLLACGADIRQINCLRKHLDRVKGGGLARWAAPARLVVLILSDVVGDPLDVIASGPTTADPTTYQDAGNILTRYNILQQTPAPILAVLESGLHGKLIETLKPGDPIFERVQNVLVGSNNQAAQAAINQARKEGFNTKLLTTSLQGEARQGGSLMAMTLRRVVESGQPVSRPACLVAGGETTVSLISADKKQIPIGLGGRNQELALAAVRDLAGLRNVMLVTLATDGGDGPTDAAGAVVTGETLQKALTLSLEPQTFLEQHDSYHFFEALGDLLKTGPTQTNVNDLTFLFAL